MTIRTLIPFSRSLFSLFSPPPPHPSLVPADEAQVYEIEYDNGVSEGEKLGGIFHTTVLSSSLARQGTSTTDG